MASNAVLNVEGQIQINGTTVIGSDGKVAVAALPESEVRMIQLSNYYMKPGKYVYEFVDSTDWIEDENGNWVEVKAKCTEVNNYIDYLKSEFITECFDFEGNLKSRWMNSWFDNGDGTVTNTFTDYYDGKEYTQTSVNEIKIYSGMAEYLPLGATTAHLEQTTPISHDGVADESGDTWLFATSRTIPTVIGDFDWNGNEYNDCVLVEQGHNWDGASSYSIHCAGIGLVKEVTENSYRSDYVLVSFEHTESKSRSSLRPTDMLMIASEKISINFIKQNL